MGDGPRRRCAQAWAWVYLALFDNGEDATDTEAASTGHDGESTQATSDEPETRRAGQICTCWPCIWNHSVVNRQSRPES